MGQQGLQQVQKQTQNLVLAPQLRQSLKILQVPALELRNVIVEELQTNPTLEDLPQDGMSLEAQTGNDEGPSDNSDSSEMDFKDDDFSILNQLDEDWKEHFSQDSSNSYQSAESDERRKHFFDSIVSEVSLQEHLINQADLSDVNDEERKALHYVIGNIDDNGFITTEPSELVTSSGIALDPIKKAIELIKHFDPPGIGCNGIADCLHQQLILKGREKSLAATIVKNHFKLLLRRRIPELARRTNTEIRDVQTAIEEIASLDPSPGRKFSEDSNRVIVPDVKVVKNDMEWEIILNNDYIPRLRLSRTYKELIAKGTLSNEEKEYIREKMRSGKFLISSIELRQQTLERITREILSFQHDFFEEGVSKLKPLTMSQVADKVGVHETTVSRAIANKYIDTPYGVFEFKYFFTSGYQSDKGESVSNTSIKELLSQIVESEDPAKPFSDQSIVKILAEKDIQIARRTVAKYREELGILPTNLRRRYR